MPRRNRRTADVREMTIELDDSMTFLPDALRALKAFRRSKPWRGTLSGRKDKFRTLHAALSAAYGVTAPELFLPETEGYASGGGVRIFPNGSRAIVLVGKLSVVTYLRMFALVRGMTNRRAAKWSVNLFRRVFPQSFRNCQLTPDGLLLRRTPTVRMPAAAPLTIRVADGFPDCIQEMLSRAESDIDA